MVTINPSENQISNTKMLTKTYTWDDIRQHSTPSDAWIVIHGRVYDISSWTQHPGGSVIFSHAGMDATDIFTVFHPTSTFRDLSTFCIGKIQKESKEIKEKNDSNEQLQHEFIKVYRQLRLEIKRLGFDQASLLYYLWKLISTFFILACCVGLCYTSTSIWIHLVASTLLGLFYQQCGWLAHDFLHHQIFPIKRQYGDYMGIFIGNVCQGFSVHWWKLKHNTHHAIPNVHHASSNNGMGDPDIDTMPLLAWSLNIAKNATNGSTFGKWMICHQALLYFPILLFARISWVIQSFGIAFNLSYGKYAKPLKNHPLIHDPPMYPILESIGLILHIGWNLCLFLLCTSRTNFYVAFGFFLWSQMTGGVFLALAFGLGHNGRMVYEDNEIRNQQMNFGFLQITTTRNIQSSKLVDWFMGGLQYQTEHHLFPTVPRHHLGKIHDLINQICKDYGIPIHQTTFLDGTKEVLQCLADISQEFIHEFPAL